MNLKKETMTALFLILVTLGASAFVYSQDWPKFGYDPQNTGYSPSSGPSVGNLQWEYTTAGYDVTSPAVVDGKVYVSSGDDKIYCLDADTGASIWNYSLYWDASSPTVARGKVYLGGESGILCLNADWGTEIWNEDYSSGQTTSPVVADGLVYIGTPGGRVWSFIADTGDFRSNYEVTGRIHSSPAVADGKVVIVHGDDDGGWVTWLKIEEPWSSLSPKWSYPFDGVNVMLSPAVADGLVYVGSEYAVHCLEYDVYQEEVTEKWEFPEEYWERVTSSPTVADGEVYIGFEDRVYCLDAYTGVPTWNYTTGFPVTSTAVADGNVYVSSDDGKIYCLNADTGAWIWEFQIEATEEIITSSPAVADGKLYVSTSNGKVYCLGSTLEERVDSLNARVSETEIKFMILPGERLNIYKQDNYAISADETTNVWHGFQSNPWDEYTEEQKTKFLSTAQWRFTVDGEEVPLDHVLRLQDGFMWSIYYREF